MSDEISEIRDFLRIKKAIEGIEAKIERKETLGSDEIAVLSASLTILTEILFRVVQEIRK